MKKDVHALPGFVVGLLLAGGFTSTALAADDDNWKATLTGGDEAAQQDTGVIGMSAEEAAAYAADAQAAAGATEETPDNFVRNRRRFVIREIKFNADWDTDPTALPAMMEQFKRRTGLDGQALQPRQPLTFDDPDITSWPFVYMTAHNAFTLSDQELAGLKKYLKNGGFLYADDCLFGFPFGPAFHGEMRRVFEGKELKPFNLDTPVFGTLLKQKYSWAATNEAGLPMTLKTNPFECIEIDGRMCILYTPPDIGCHWEISTPPTPSNPLGAGMHSLDEQNPGGREAAYRMGVNIFFYVQTH